MFWSIHNRSTPSLIPALTETDDLHRQGSTRRKHINRKFGWLTNCGNGTAGRMVEHCIDWTVRRQKRAVYLACVGPQWIWSNHKINCIFKRLMQ